jgi:hypothetical protein
MGLSEQEQREQNERDRQAQIERAGHIELGLAFMLDKNLSLTVLAGGGDASWSFEEDVLSPESYGEFPSPADALVALGKANGDYYGL